MAQRLNQQSFESVGARTIVGNIEIVDVVILAPMLIGPPTPSDVVASVEQRLIPKAPPSVVVRSASATITASMPPAARLAGAAQVRAAQGSPTSSSKTLVIDFGALRTVTELVAPSGTTITKVQAWLGTKFDENTVDGLTAGLGGAVSFQELQAERLLVTLSSPSAPAAFASGASVVLPTPPSNLELLVNGTRAWFRAGPALGAPFALPEPIDLTDAVATAAAAGNEVVVSFRAAAPAALTLQATATVLQRYPVAFPDGAVRTVDAPTEGVYPVSLPISSGRPDAADADTWAVQYVVLDVSAKLPPTRVIPPAGPGLTADAELVLDPDHALVVRLPRSATSALASLTGVRLPVVVGDQGAELAGTLRAGTATAPGDAIAKGQLGPVTLQPPDASAGTTATWIDLALTTAHPLQHDEYVWLEVQVARGSVTWKLGVPAADDDDDAPLRRRTSSGTYVPLSALDDVPYTGALRVVGQEKANDPLAALEVAVTGSTSTVAGVPTQAGATLILGLNPAASTRAADGGDRELPLELTISAPGSYSITAAELQYTTTGS